MVVAASRRLVFSGQNSRKRRIGQQLFAELKERAFQLKALGKSLRAITEEVCQEFKLSLSLREVRRLIKRSEKLEVVDVGYAESRRRCRERYQQRCWVCSRGYRTQVHHVIPRSMGGADVEQNMVLLCSTCHDAVHNQTGRARRHSKISFLIECIEKAKHSRARRLSIVPAIAPS